MQVGVGLLVSDVMSIYMIIALDIVITMRFYINCSAVICVPTICYVLERDASSECYGPRVHLNHITKPLNILLQFIYLLLSDLILAKNEYTGIDNPIARVGCKYLLLCVYVPLKFVCVNLILVR